ncbi:TrkH family potassium uptake protein [Corynebacterium pseudopelargi]|uniref:Ktr system potassium uptake protein B n=1 Tax=Corynebacterium pseudopelargi TaxID=2080757 RepID=A0A3G6ISC3_9CORY|nr:TrkH family potassium uptake protein [Corynebacterium pseudopelargi]AZA08521.1 Ktr system potassium uptake protein B [Corynebacterium pseudopelargi]
MHKTPARLVASSFGSLILVGCLLLLLPVSKTGDGGADFVTALFTATSAVCLTGLIVVDTATYWTHFGQLIILILIQLGGLGIMTLTTFVSWVLAGRIGVRSRLNAAAEGRGRQLGEVKGLLIATISFTLAVETVLGIILTLRFHAYGYDWAASLWEGTFHSISAFNNAGFSLKSDNLVQFVGDWIIILPISFAIIIGGLGFPLLLEFYRRWRARRRRQAPPRFSISGIFVMVGTVTLLTVGFVGTAVIEWTGVLGHLDTPTKILSAFFHSVSSRTAGFNSVDIGAMHPNSLLLTDILMFIGGGTGGTAGGMKITTMAVILAVMVAEVRGDEHVLVHKRRIPNRSVRQAIAVTVMAGLLVVSAIMLIMLVAPQFDPQRVTFEVVSAFGTVGLSTGITGDLPKVAQLIIVVLMFAGRIGPVSLVSALASRDSKRLYCFPDERPLIG